MSYYFDRNGERVLIRGIKDLKKGDIVYVSSFNQKVTPAIVARVRTVECATIVTIKRNPHVENVRYVGYHTGMYAQSDYENMLSVDSVAHERLHNAWSRIEENTEKDASRAEALYAMKILRNWLRGNDRKASHGMEYSYEL